MGGFMRVNANITFTFKRTQDDILAMGGFARVNGNFNFTLKRSTDDILARGVRGEWWMLTQSAASYTNHHLPATILTHKLPPTQRDKHKHKQTNAQTKIRTQIATHTEHTNGLSPHLAPTIFLVFFTNIFH